MPRCAADGEERPEPRIGATVASRIETWRHPRFRGTKSSHSFRHLAEHPE
jgi:hypothetical protein